MITFDRIGNKKVWWFTSYTNLWKLSREVARKCKKQHHWISKWIWEHQSSACTNCGALVGFNSVVTRFGFTCWTCKDILVEREKFNNPNI